MLVDLSRMLAADYGSVLVGGRLSDLATEGLSQQAKQLFYIWTTYSSYTCH